MNELTDIAPEQLFDWYSRKSNKLTFEQQGEIMELYFGCNVPVQDIAKRFEVSQWTILRVIELFFAKPVTGLSIMSRV